MFQDVFEDIVNRVGYELVEGVSEEIDYFFGTDELVRDFDLMVVDKKYVVNVTLMDYSISNMTAVFTKFLSFMTYSKSGFFIRNDYDHQTEYLFLTSTGSLRFLCNIIFRR